MIKTFYGRPVPRIECEKGTWLDGEELAYNTYSGSAHGSGRRAKALCEDGKLRTFSVGVADTFFTCPAVGKINNKYAMGCISMEDGVVIFHQHNKEK